MARLMLQGQYYNKLRQLGIVSGIASVVGGVATYYGFFVHRGKVFTDYETNTLVPAMQAKLDKKVDTLMGLGSYSDQERKGYPTLLFPPMLDTSTDEGAIESLTRAAMWRKEYLLSNLEFKRLKRHFGKNAAYTYSRIYFDNHTQKTYFKTEASRKRNMTAFANYRKKFAEYVQKSADPKFLKLCKELEEGKRDFIEAVKFLSEKKLTRQTRKDYLYYACLCHQRALKSGNPIRDWTKHDSETREQLKSFFEQKMEENSA